MTTTDEILAPKTILKAVSQLELPGAALQRLFGWGFSGRNKTRQSGRNFSYDIFDMTRTVATGRGPGQEAGRQPAQHLGGVNGAFPRSAETIPLKDEDLLNRRPIGRSTASLDEAGESYITRQEIYLAQRFSNLIEFQTAAMLRGHYGWSADGDDLRHGFTGVTQVDFKIPDGGVKQLLRLRMVKDAYVGDIVWYPPDRPVQLPDGRTVSWREVAQEVAENRTSGGALMLPLVYDHDGRKLVDYTPPQETGSAGAMFQWKRDVDLELWKALEVPPEILEANASGSGYSGRWIPFVVAVSAVQTELSEIVRCLDRDILQPLVRLNFGCEARYEIRPLPLMDAYTESMAPPA